MISNGTIKTYISRRLLGSRNVRYRSPDIARQTVAAAPLTQPALERD